ncbi:MAG: hypothetical protein KF708_00420 [Pirellulales bacterium]|nr:hypothetical protein [Pirellulales bacterium]
MSKSKSIRTPARPQPPRPAALESHEPAPPFEPHPPARRRGLLVASLVLLAVWIAFLIGLALFGS